MTASPNERVVPPGEAALPIPDLRRPAGASPDFATLCDAYRPTAEHNDRLWRWCTEFASGASYLARHRDWVEANAWGFGDRAFHAMWHLLLTGEVLQRDDPACLEIGVYKGQVISLWALVAREHGRRLRITAVSPLEGTAPRRAGIRHRLQMLTSARYREDVRNGNHYDRVDYRAAVERIFAEFSLDFSAVDLRRGYSTDEAIKAGLAGERFTVVYVDGSHRYEDVRHDIAFYGAMVVPGGFLVLDDASCFQPGTAFWKGHESVSRAAEEVDPGAFANVLNVGHNRIYRRL